MNNLMREMEITGRANIGADVSSRLAIRRLCWPAEEMNLYLLDLPRNYARAIILTWIDNHTEGLFYLDGRQIGFQNEKDEIMFKLGCEWNATT